MSISNKPSHNKGTSTLNSRRKEVPMRYLSNAFSGQMIMDDELWIHRSSVTPEEVPTDAKSVIGHIDTARVVSTILNREVPCNRESIALREGDELYVAQITGGRLPEGATTLPEGASMVFHRYTVGRPRLKVEWDPTFRQSNGFQQVLVTVATTGTSTLKIGASSFYGDDPLQMSAWDNEGNILPLDK